MTKNDQHLEFEERLKAVKRIQRSYWLILALVFAMGAIGGFLLADAQIERVTVVACGGIEV